MNTQYLNENGKKINAVDKKTKQGPVRWVSDLKQLLSKRMAVNSKPCASDFWGPL